MKSNLVIFISILLLIVSCERHNNNNSLPPPPPPKHIVYLHGKKIECKSDAELKRLIDSLGIKDSATKIQ